MTPIALITGGNGTLANALASELSARGSRVLSPSRAILDVENPNSVCDYLSRIESPPSLVVLNAGVICDMPFARMRESEWDDVISVNLSGAFRCVREVVNRWVESHPHFVLIGSYSGKVGAAGQVNYSSAKAGLFGLLGAVAKEGIRANLILPGFMETKMTKSLSTGLRAKLKQEHVLEFNSPEMVAKFITTLHFDMPNVSGQVFQTDSRIS